MEGKKNALLLLKLQLTRGAVFIFMDYGYTYHH